MTEELKEILEELGLPVSYRHERDAAAPYITYYVEDTVIASSDTPGPRVYTESCVVELHTAEKDAALEAALEELLREYDLNKHEEFDYSEYVFEVTYRFTARYKRK